MNYRSLVGFDIETTGLNPEDSRVVAAALVGHDFETVLVDLDEPSLLNQLETEVSRLPRFATLLTWNGEGFDIPFLSHRMRISGIATSLRARSRGFTGKYDLPLFEAEWGEHDHIDISYFYRGVADDLGIPWSLKPVARALGLRPIEVDRNGDSIAALDSRSLAAYVASDARVTVNLASRLFSESVPLVG